MKGYLAVLKYFFAYLPLLRGLNYLGLILCAISLLPVGWADIARKTGLLALLFVPVLAGGFQFRHLISNPRFTLAPNARPLLALALATIALLAALGAAWLTGQPTTFTWVFLVVTSYLLLSQWAICYAWGGVLITGLIVALANLPSHLATPWLNSLFQQYWPLVLLGTTLAWLAFYLWLPRQVKLRSPQPFNGSLIRAITETKDSPQTAQGDPVWAMLLAGRGSLSRNFRSYCLLFWGYPVLMGLLLCIQDWSLKPFLALFSDGHSAFLFTFYGFLMAPAVTLEVVPRLRWLWLRQPGHRTELWQKLDSLLWRQTFIASAPFLAAIAMIGIGTKTAPITLLLMVPLGCSYLWASQQLVCWLRQCQWPMLVSCLVGIGLLGLSLALAIHWFLGNNSAWIALAYNLIVGLVARQGLKIALNRQDWIRLKPTQKRQWQRGF